ncbi:MAG TPA: condensation domain-containing protein, partial [Pyrinomonadaceae bacterium]
SMGVLVREVTALYAAYASGAEESPLGELPIQYADFAVWQREFLRGEVLARQLDYWRAQLSELPPPLELPTDHARPAAPTFRAAQHQFALGPELAQALGELSRREGATIFMTLLAAFQALLQRYTGRPEIVVGSNIANRTRVETEGLIGFFVNMLVLRTDFAGEPTFAELLGRVREMLLDAYAHQDVPFDRLVETLQPERGPHQTPFFNVVFSLQNAPAAPLEMPGLTLEPVMVGTGTAKYDLVVNMWADGDDLRGGVDYNAELFEAATVARLVEHFESLLRHVALDPGARLSEVELLSAAEGALLRQPVEVEEFGQSFSF